MRAGDTVQLIGTRLFIKDPLILVVGCVRGERFIACGWPTYSERIEDFKMIQETNDTYHVKTLRENYEAKDRSNDDRRSYARAEILASTIEDPWILETKIQLQFENERNNIGYVIKHSKTREELYDNLKILVEAGP